MKQVGTVEIMKDRIYPLDANSPHGGTEVLVPPGVYPLYRNGDTRFWLMEGVVNLRVEKVGDGMFVMRSHDKPSEIPVKFPSRMWGPDQWESFIMDESNSALVITEEAAS